MVPYAVLPAGHLHFLPRLVVAGVRHAADRDAVGEIEWLVHHESPLLGRERTTRCHNESASGHALEPSTLHLEPPFTCVNLAVSRIAASSDNRAYRRVVVMLACGHSGSGPPCLHAELAPALDGARSSTSHGGGPIVAIPGVLYRESYHPSPPGSCSLRTFLTIRL